MATKSGRLAAWGVTVALCASSLVATAQAQDFFSALFGALGGRRLAPPQIVLPFANEGLVGQALAISPGNSPVCARPGCRRNER